MGYKFPKNAICKKVNKNEKIKLENINIDYKVDKHPHSIYINKDGLYNLLMNSNMNGANKFKHLIKKNSFQIYAKSWTV